MRDHIRRFTLLELLVVITIIAVIAAMLLPAISKARAKARARTCANNIKQQLTGLMMYADEHRGVIVSPFTDPGSTWNLILLQNDYVAVGSSSETFLCPDYEPFRYSDADSSKVYGMRFTDDTKFAADPDAAWNKRHTAMGRIIEPTTYYLITDSVLATAGHQWYVTAVNDLLSDLRIHARHDVKANCGFADGSVRMLTYTTLLSERVNAYAGK